VDFVCVEIKDQFLNKQFILRIPVAALAIVLYCLQEQESSMIMKQLPFQNCFHIAILLEKIN